MLLYLRTRIGLHLICLKISVFSSDTFLTLALSKFDFTFDLFDK